MELDKSNVIISWIRRCLKHSDSTGSVYVVGKRCKLTDYLAMDSTYILYIYILQIYLHLQMSQQPAMLRDQKARYWLQKKTWLFKVSQIITISNRMMLTR